MEGINRQDGAKLQCTYYALLCPMAWVCLKHSSPFCGRNGTRQSLLIETTSHSDSTCSPTTRTLREPCICSGFFFFFWWGVFGRVVIQGVGYHIQRFRTWHTHIKKLQGGNVLWHFYAEFRVRIRRVKSNRASSAFDKASRRDCAAVSWNLKRAR